MSLDLRPVQVRLCDEAYEALRMIAEANEQDPKFVKQKLRLVAKGNSYVTTCAALSLFTNARLNNAARSSYALGDYESLVED